MTRSGLRIIGFVFTASGIVFMVTDHTSVGIVLVTLGVVFIGQADFLVRCAVACRAPNVRKTLKDLKTNPDATSRGALFAALLGGPAMVAFLWMQIPNGHPINSIWIYAIGYIFGTALAALVYWQVE
jgi:hypothetical protein